MVEWYPWVPMKIGRVVSMRIGIEEDIRIGRVVSMPLVQWCPWRLVVWYPWVPMKIGRVLPMRIGNEVDIRICRVVPVRIGRMVNMRANGER